MSTRSLRYTSQDLHIPKGRLASGSDRDAGRFLEAAGIFNSRQQRAIYELVRLLKHYGIWSKMKAIYPFVGGTATTHKWNLKDPRDLDAAFRLTFNGGWTHSSTGAKPNGTNGYADSFVNPSNNLSLNSQHLSFYSREEKAVNPNFQVCMGVTDGGNSKRSMVYYDGSTTTTFYGNINDTFTGTADWVTYTLASAKGLSMSNRASSTDLQAWRNATKRNNKTETADGLANSNIWIGNAGTPTGAYATNTYIPLECAFASIGDGLTDTEAANLYYAVQRYQQILGRAV